jgi:hypothetical protein
LFALVFPLGCVCLCSHLPCTFDGWVPVLDFVIQGFFPWTTILHQSHIPQYLCNRFVSLERKPTACPCKWHVLNYRQIMNVLTHLHMRYKNPTSPHCTHLGMPWLVVILFHSTFRGSWCDSGAQILVFSRYYYGIPCQRCKNQEHLWYHSPH